ncbi:hypothetical protein FAM09_14790 [Niastella caeni]|uniref:Uncharacterized protein n=1 Tax=Niastella caeni TaxID=2569763 RepID=A0A4S8HWC4_9BACT|nr:hypothetical protein [Niastella caeni]THU39755.1 hypothetical protein FAM09_14790 [Niastella caeni]
MPLQTTLQALSDLTKTFTYKTIGDKYETAYGDIVIDNFKNSELFWQRFVTPITKRIDSAVINPNDKIRPRQNISLDLQELSSIHYSVFLNLVYAGQCLTNKHFSYFENFYAHLGSACDLAEEFLTQLYFISLECEEKQTTVLEKLSKGKFLDIAKDWYDKYYASTYQHYLSKGKTAPIKLISRANILDEYFSKSKEWKEYSTTALQIRTYRNVVVHNTQIASIWEGNQVFVPKKTKIQNYKKWYQVFSVKQDRFPHDFIDRDQQMHNDFVELKEKLNALWEKPLKHFETLVFVDKNKKLLNKYDIEYTD